MHDVECKKLKKSFQYLFELFGFALTVDGGFSKWSAWTTCSASCGTGLQLRYRNCTNPPPAHGGKNCESRNIYEGRSCNMKACQSGKPAGIGFPSLSDTRSMQYLLSGGQRHDA